MPHVAREESGNLGCPLLQRSRCLIIARTSKWMNGGVAKRSEAFCILWLVYAKLKNAQRSAEKKQGIARNGVLSYFEFMCFLFL